MGFSHFHQLIDSEAYRNQNKDNIQNLTDLIKTTNNNKINSWLLIDISNIRFISNYNSGGHASIQRLLEETFWANLLSSHTNKNNTNLHIVIFFDGRGVDDMRSIIKMNRLLNEISPALLSDLDSDITKNLSIEYFTNYIYDKVMSTTLSPSTTSSTTTSSTIEIIRCIKESDPEIRAYARSKTSTNTNSTSSNDHVYIVSEDCSLILGIEGNISLVSPLRMRICKDQTNNTTTTTTTTTNNNNNAALYTTITPIYEGKHSFCVYLKHLIHNEVKLSTKYIDTEFDSHCLLLLSAILGGEYESHDTNRNSDPYILIKFLPNFIFSDGSPYRFQKGQNSDLPKQKNMIKLGQLISIAAVILSWKYECILHNCYYTTPTTTPTTTTSNTIHQPYIQFKQALIQIKNINRNSRKLYNIIKGDVSYLYTKEIESLGADGCMSTIWSRISGHLPTPSTATSAAGVGDAPANRMITGI